MRSCSFVDHVRVVGRPQQHRSGSPHLSAVGCPIDQSGQLLSRSRQSTRLVSRSRRFCTGYTSSHTSCRTGQWSQMRPRLSWSVHLRRSHQPPHGGYQPRTLAMRNRVVAMGSGRHLDEDYQLRRGSARRFSPCLDLALGALGQYIRTSANGGTVTAAPAASNYLHRPAATLRPSRRRRLLVRAANCSPSNIGRESRTATAARRRWRNLAVSGPQYRGISGSSDARWREPARTMISTPLLGPYHLSRSVRVSARRAGRRPHRPVAGRRTRRW